MKILVDTSVWSLALRRRQGNLHPLAETLNRLIDSGQDIAITGLILQEILQGVADKRQFDQLKSCLEAYSVLPTSSQTHILAAEIYNTCQVKGVRLATIDCAIAATCIEHDRHLLSADKDFERLSQIVPLRLLRVKRQ